MHHTFILFIQVDCPPLIPLNDVIVVANIQVTRENFPINQTFLFIFTIRMK